MSRSIPAEEKWQVREDAPPVAHVASSGPIRLTLVCAAILAALVVATSAYFFSNLRDHVLAENRRQLENTASLLAQQIGHLFDAVRSVQAEVVTLVSSETLLQGDLLRELAGNEVHLKLRDKIAGMPYVGSLALFDAQGDLVNFSRQWPRPSIHVADHEFFRILKADAGAATFLGEPAYNSVSGTRVMHLARRLSGPAGEFIGIVSAELELEYFQQYFEGVELAPDGGIALLRADGVLLMRHPIIDSDIGRIFPNVMPLQLVAETDRGIGQSSETLDGLNRIVAAHRVAGYPLVVAAAHTIEGALADWRNAANYLVVIVGFILLGIAGFAWLFIRLFRNHQAFVRMRAEQTEAERIREQNIRFNAALNNMTQGLLMFDTSARVVVCNERYLQMYNLTPEQIVPGMTLAEIVRLRAECGSFIGDQEKYCREILAAMAVGQTLNHVHETSDGRLVYVVNRPMDNGGWVATLEDVTDRTRAERERDHNRKLLDLVIDNVPATIAVKDIRDLKYVLVNRTGEEHYGIPRTEMIGKTVHDVLPAASADMVTRLDRQFLQAPDRPLVYEHTIVTPRSGPRTSIVTRLPIRSESGELQYLLAVVNDVTERREAEARIVHMAHHDALTDLPNRTLLRELLEREVVEAKEGRCVAVHYLDLDNFKSVNDTLGHIAGDELIKGVAQRMRACLGKGDMIARFGGDEFVIVQTGVERPLDAADLAQAVRGAVARRPFDVGGHQVVIDVSIGIALAPEDSRNPDELLKFADMALYGAKADGRGTYHFFEPKLDARMKARRGLEVDLRRALENGEFELHYQPVMAMRDNSVSGFEALLRWRHPTRGLVSPAEFIPIAEEIGLIIPLGEWVLREACAQAAQWPDGLRVAVNISPVHFIGQSFVQAVVHALASSSLPADRLEIEITEAVLLQSTERTLNTMQLLHDLGVRIAMDDFGIGYSSLSYLRNFPFDKIKIDRSFIKDIAHQENSRAIMRAVVTLGNCLGMTTTAEGIETEEQMEILRAEGCAEMQGYLFSPARPAAEIERLFLRRHGARRSAAA